jgi:transposase-like protein
MKYRCRDCKFTWEGFPDTFEKVLAHEKTHKKGKTNADL